MRFAFWLPVFVLATCGIARAQISILQDGLPLSKDAIMLLPAEQASASSVEQTDWSPSGNFLLIRRRALDYSTLDIERILGGTQDDNAIADDEIAVYASLTGGTKVVYSLPSPGTIERAMWIPGTDSMLVQTRVIDGTIAHRSLVLLSATGGDTGTLMAELPLVFEVGTAPRVPLAYLAAPSQTPGATDIHFIGSKGFTQTVATVQATGGLIFPRNGGRDLYYMKPGASRKESLFWKINPQTGAVVSVDKFPQESLTAEPAREVNVVIERHLVGEGKNATSASVVALTNEGNQNSVVVTTDGSEAELAADDKAVCYRSRGSLLVRRIVRVPLDFFKNQLKVALRKKALDTAKNLGLSLIMYSNDYDDALPGNGKGWQDKIGPYLKNPEMAAQFNYTFAGGTMAGIQNPASTQLGYVDGPDGKAVVFADGHAVWVGQ